MLLFVFACVLAQHGPPQSPPLEGVRFGALKLQSPHALLSLCWVLHFACLGVSTLLSPSFVFACVLAQHDPPQSPPLEGVRFDAL